MIGVRALRSLALLVLPVSVEAGRPQAASVLDGVVTDSTLAPIADATASILGSSVHVTTGSNGRFRIVSLAPGQYILAIHRLGYIASSTSIVIGGADTLRLSFTLAPITRVLDTVPVHATRVVARLAEFEERRHFGQGRFMTQEDIEKFNLVATRDLLQTLPFVAVETTAVNMRAGCAFQFFVDGLKMHYPTRVESELPSPKEIAGIEVYANSAFVPLRYKTFNAGGVCGIILIWTRAGS